jgi:hypothetical protein
LADATVSPSSLEKGRVFTVTNHLKDAKALATHIAKQLHAPLVVEALTAISKGHHASFGPRYPVEGGH